MNLVSLYSDELHMQQDWYYFNHHDNGQFALRFYTNNLAKVYNEKYNVNFPEKYILYFAYGAASFENGARAVINYQYVMGPGYEDIQRTFLFRDRYYKMINNTVVDLFKEAKSYGEKLFNRRFPTAGHASWAESPTIDLWNTEKLEEDAYQYEYTSNFIWSNTVQQAAAGCYDYFKWGEYLQPTGNDFAECGWNDRDYYGAAMAVSIGVINKYPPAYAAFWGMPKEVQRRKEAINSAFGGTRNRSMELLTGKTHRLVNVLILYPMNLVAVEERFGSWMTQYGYANYITADKLLEMGKINEQGEIVIKDQKYNTLVALFNPLPADSLLAMMDKFSSKGGNLIWFGPPALINDSGNDCESEWKSLFKTEYTPSPYMGEIAAGKIVSFKGKFQDVPDQCILTDFLVDRAYPVTPMDNAEVVATVDGKTVGVYSKNGKGKVAFFGFRPRDDQSASLGYDPRTLFNILNTIGAYPGTGIFNVNDNTEFISRTTDYLATRFRNNTVAVVRHFRTYRENWPDGFSRDTSVDNAILRMNPLPSDKIALSDFKINGHVLNFSGSLIMAFRVNDNHELVAFYGQDCNDISIDGKDYDFSNTKLKNLCFSPPAHTPIGENQLLIKAEGNGKLKIPMTTEMKTSKRFTLKNNAGKNVKCKRDSNYFIINLDNYSNGKWLTLEY